MMINTKGCSETACDIYAEVIKRLFTLWGQRVWHLIYEADDQMRCEGIDRIRRQTNRTIDEGAPPPRGYDPASPWTYCMIAAAKNSDWWNEHVTSQAVKWIADGAKGVPQTVEEQLRAVMTPGMVHAAPQVQHIQGNEAVMTKQQRKAANRRANQWQKPEWKGPSVIKHKCKGKGDKGNHGKGQGKGANEKYACHMYNKGYGDCGPSQPGSTCGKGRLHVCMYCKAQDHKGKDCPQKPVGA